MDFSNLWFFRMLFETEHNLQGAALEREASIRTLIHFSHKNNIPRDNLIQQLITEYHLSDDDVQQLIAKYWE